MCAKLYSEKQRERPFGVCWCRWEDIIKMDVKEIGCASVELNSTDSEQESVVGYCKTVMNLRAS
jgi:hypothetical protein